MKRLMVSSFWKIVKQSPRSLFRYWIQEHGQTINYEQPVKKVITLYCFYSSEKKQKTFWQQLNKFSFGNLSGTHYHYAILSMLDKLFWAVFTRIKYCRHVISCKENKVLEKDWWELYYKQTRKRAFISGCNLAVVSNWTSSQI